MERCFSITPNVSGLNAVAKIPMKKIDKSFLLLRLSHLLCGEANSFYFKFFKRWKKKRF